MHTNRPFRLQLFRLRLRWHLIETKTQMYLGFEIFSQKDHIEIALLRVL